MAGVLVAGGAAGRGLADGGRDRHHGKLAEDFEHFRTGRDGKLLDDSYLRHWRIWQRKVLHISVGATGGYVFPHLRADMVGQHDSVLHR